MPLIDLFIIAWRSLLRKKRRTFLTASSVAFGVWLSVSFTASGDYSYTNMINSSATMGLGHLTLESKGFTDNPTLASFITETEALKEYLQKNDEIEAVFTRILGQGIFASGSKSLGGQFMAIDPQKETQEYNFYLQYIEKGHLFTAKEQKGVVIGAKLAEKLKLDLGKKLIYTCTDKNGEIVSAVSRVTGIFRSGEDGIDSSMILLPINRVQAILGYEKDSASILAIFIQDQRKAVQLAQQLDKNLKNNSVEILPYQKTQTELAGLIAMDKASNYVLQFLIGLLIAAGILNTILMNVMERTREFGMMMAVGMSPGQIIKLVMIESFLIGLLGLIVGTLITTPWYIYMSEIGLNLSKQIGHDYNAAGVLIDPVLKFKLFKESAAFIIIAIFALTMAAGVYPAYRAGKINPVDSLKFL